MTLHISEAEVRAVLTMPQAVEAVEEISRKQATGEVVVHPRRRFELPGGGFFHYMAAADFSLGFVAMKQYTYVRGKLRLHGATENRRCFWRGHEIPGAQGFSRCCNYWHRRPGKNAA